MSSEEKREQDRVYEWAYNATKNVEFSAIYDIGRLGNIGLWSTKTAFSYDENNTLIGMKRYAPLGILLEERRYEYEFDDKANWIKKSEFAWREEGGKSDWKLIGEEARAIKYYD